MPDSSIAGTLFAGAVPAIPLDASYYQLKQRVDHKGRPKGKLECGHWHFVTSWLTQQQFEQLTHYALSNTACFDAHAEYGRSDGLGAFVTVWGTGCYLVGWREEFDARGTNGQEASHRVHLTLSPQEMGRQAGAKGEFIAPQSRDYPYTGAAANVAAASPTAAAEAARAKAVAAQKEMEEDLVAASKKRADDLVAERKRILAANEGKQPKRQEPQTVTSPVTAAVADPKMIDPTTGKPTIYHGENFKVSAEYGYIAFEMFMEQAHPVLKARIKGQEDLIASGWKPENERSGDNPGAHAEIVAVNKALMAREAAKLKVDDSSIEELYLHNRWLLKGQYPDGAAKMCSHCKRILSGINTIGHE